MTSTHLVEHLFKGRSKGSLLPTAAITSHLHRHVVLKHPLNGPFRRSYHHLRCWYWWWYTGIRGYARLDKQDETRGL
jgi:hypothetical protein